LADLFAEVLELEQVGVEDKFFDLGGDSLSSVDLATRARDAGLSITPLAVLQHQTVKALAAAEAASGKAAPPPPAPVAASAEPA
jgi:acyl carrier protein